MKQWNINYQNHTLSCAFKTGIYFLYYNTCAKLVYKHPLAGVIHLLCTLLTSVV